MNSAGTLQCCSPAGQGEPLTVSTSAAAAAYTDCGFVQVSAVHGEQGEAEETPHMDHRVVVLRQEGGKFGRGSTLERESNMVSQYPFQSTTECERSSAVMQVRFQGRSIVGVVVGGVFFSCQSVMFDFTIIRFSS